MTTSLERRHVWTTWAPHREGVFALLALAVAHVVVLWNFIGPGILSATISDPGFFLAHSAFWQRSLHAGEFPLWNPYVQYGSPEFWQFHPLVVLIHALAPSGIAAYKLYTFLPGWLAGIGAWLFLGLFVRHRVARLLGALMVQYGAFGFTYLTNPLVLLGFAHLPFLLYAVERAVRDPAAMRPYVGIFFVTTLLMLNAYPQTILYGLLGAGAYLIGRLAVVPGGFKARARVLGLAAAFALLGIGAGIVPLLLLAEVPGQMHEEMLRFLRSEEWYLSGSLSPLDLFTFFALNFFPESGDARFSFFNNLLPWLTLGVLLYVRRRPGPRILPAVVAAVAVGYFFAFGSHNPAYRWILSLLPENFRIDGPRRALLITSALLPLPAVLGFQELLDESARRRRDLPAAVIVIGALLLTVFSTERLALALPPERQLLYGGYAAAAALLVMACLGTPRARTACALGLVVLAVLTPITAGLIHPWYRSARHTLAVETVADNPALEFVRPQPGGPRYTSTVGDPIGEYYTPATLARLRPDSQLLYGVFGTGNYMTAMRHRGAFLESVAAEEFDSPDGPLPLTRMAAVRWVISGRPLPNRLLRPIRQLASGEHETYIYEVPKPLPRAFVPSTVTSVPGGWELLRHGDRFEPAEIAVIDAPGLRPQAPILAGRTETSGPGSVRINEYGLQYVSLSVVLDRSGWVVLNDTFYPGWKASIDGQPAEIHRANYLFRGVFVPPGRHTLTYAYLPPRLTLGVLIAAISSGAALLLFLWIRGRPGGLLAEE